jgi:hypothetical protein
MFHTRKFEGADVERLPDTVRIYVIDVVLLATAAAGTTVSRLCYDSACIGQI